MRRNNYKKNIIFIFILLFVISGISISYALLSSTLDTNIPTTTISNLRMDVRFVEISDQAAIYEPLVNYASECANGTNGIILNGGGTGFSYNAKLITGSKCKYKLLIKNLGSVDVKLSSLTSNYPNGSSCSNSVPGKFTCDNGNFTYALYLDSDLTTYVNNSNIEIGPGEGTYVYFVITVSDNYSGTYNAFDSGGFNFNFVLK